MHVSRQVSCMVHFARLVSTCGQQPYCAVPAPLSSEQHCLLVCILYDLQLAAFTTNVALLHCILHSQSHIVQCACQHLWHYMSPTCKAYPCKHVLIQAHPPCKQHNACKHTEVPVMAVVGEPCGTQHMTACSTAWWHVVPASWPGQVMKGVVSDQGTAALSICNSRFA